MRLNRGGNAGHGSFLGGATESVMRLLRELLAEGPVVAAPTRGVEEEPKALARRARSSFRSMALAPRIAAGVCFSVSLVPAMVRAETYTVTSLQDGNNVAGSLRAAVNSANNNPGPDSIGFSMPSGTIVLTEGQLNLYEAVSITAAGNGNIVIDANHVSRAINIVDPNSNAVLQDVLLQGLTIQNANTTNAGGGIYVKGMNVALNQVNLLNNSAYRGGGLYSGSNGNPNITITQSTVTGNSAIETGGGLYTYGANEVQINNVLVSNNSAARNGGGFIFYNCAAVSVQDSVFSGNVAQGTSHSGYTGVGGGIFAREGTGEISSTTISDNTALYGGGLATRVAELVVHEVTFSGNTASQMGGAVANVKFHGEGGGVVTIVNTTMNNNTAPLGSAIGASNGNDIIRFSTLVGNSATVGALAMNNSNVTIDSTIIAGNGNDLYQTGGTFTSRFSIIENANNATITGDSNDIKGVAANLGSLAHNGGDVETMLPLAGSPALAAATSDPNAVPATDARGVPRPTATPPDIGAVQLARCGSTLEGSSCACDNACLGSCTCSSMGTCSGTPVTNGTACGSGSTCQDGSCVAASTTTTGGGTTGGAGGTTTGGSTGGTTGTHSTPTTTTTGGTSTTKKSGCAATPIDTAASLLGGLVASWWAARRRKS